MNLRLIELGLTQEQVSARINLLRRVVSISGILLFAMTWRLWTPQTVFPQVPLIGLFGFLPTWVEWLLAGVVAITLLVAASFKTEASYYWRLSLLAFSGSVGLFVLIDQHRLQPWAYQFALIAVVLSLARPRTSLQLLRWLTISIYFHSAVSKLDYSFVHTHGQQLISALIDSCGLSTSRWDSEFKVGTALLLPIGELTVAAGLAFRRTRVFALAGALVMHLMLLLAVGPLGLNHKPPVLFWNVFFIVQNIFLFSGNLPIAICRRILNSLGKANLNDECMKDASNAVSERRITPPKPEYLANAVVIIAAISPLLEPFGYFDHWPSWAVYASKPERIRIYVYSEAARRQLNPIHQTYPDDFPVYIGVGFKYYMYERNVNKWSLDALNVPAYPQNRFYLGVAQHLAYESPDKIVDLVFEYPANRWTGDRESILLTGIKEIEHFAENRFILNTRPIRRK